MQITTYNIVIGVLFGEKSILYKEIEKMIDHMDDNKTEYKKLGNDTNKFFVQVLFKMDLLIQQLLESCKSAEKFKHVKFGFFKKELKTMRNAIIGRSFSCSLPAIYTSKDKDKLLTRDDMGMSTKDKYNNSNNNVNNKKNESSAKNEQGRNNNNNNNGNQNQNNNSNKSKQTNNKQNTETPTDNPELNQDWKLPQDFQVNAFLKENSKTNPLPKYRGNAFCVHYLAKGRCRNGATCGYEHTDPRSVGIGEEWGTYVKKMQAKIN